MLIDNFALIIGAMKCGTTSLFQYLAQHPHVAPSSPKEIRFFSLNENWHKGFNWYQTRWQWDPSRHRVALEASPSYTALPRRPNVAERIAQVRADFRFIYLLRDPIERIESHYAHAVRKAKAPASGMNEVPPQWLELSKYAMQLAPYRERFSADRVLLLDFDDLKTEPVQLVKRVCRFLGIDDAFPFKGLDVPHNVSRKDHPAYQALARNPVARAAAKLVPLRYKQRIRNRFSLELNDSVKLTREQCDIIRGELADDMRRLREEYGFDTSRWCGPTPE
jgi:hypothetical protein